MSGGRPRIGATVALATAILLAACGRVSPEATGDDGRRVHVLAAASLANLLESLAADLERVAGGPVVVVTGGSSTVARQAMAGADCDILLSADAAWIDELDARGLVAERRPLPGNGLVVIVPAGAAVMADATAAATLQRSAVRRIAIADPEAVPAGRHARRALEHAGLWDAVQSRLVPAGNVRVALTWVEAATVDAGIVYATDAMVSDRARVAAPLPPDPAHPVRGAAALLPAGSDHPGARRVWDFLAGPEAMAAFERLGFQVAGSDGP